MKRFAAKGLRSNAQIMSTSVSLLTNRLSNYPKRVFCELPLMKKEGFPVAMMHEYACMRKLFIRFNLISLFYPIICDLFRRSFIAVNLVIQTSHFFG